MNRLVLGSEFRDAIVAHELAHYLLGHDAPLAGRHRCRPRREREQRELDANAKAVEILVWVKRVPEDQALRMVYSYLLNVHRRLKRSPGEDLLGHQPPCDEIADLLRRYPGPARLDRRPRMRPAPPRGGRIDRPEVAWYNYTATVCPSGSWCSLVSTLDCQSRGRGFKSRRARH